MKTEHTLNTGFPFPPGDWSFTDPKTKRKYSLANGLAQTGELVSQHRSANGHGGDSLPAIMEEIGEDLCRQLPPDLREKHCVERASGRTLKDRLTGAGALAKIAMKGEGAFVDFRTALKRAKACGNCPMNRHLDKTAEERLEDKVMAATVRRFRTGFPGVHEDRLADCGACWCALKPKIHLTLDVARTGLNQAKINLTPKFCWLTKGLERTPGAPGDNIQLIRGCACG